MWRSPWPKASASAARGGYYDKSGAIRDMVQNHVMQLVALTAMEPPVTYDAESVRNQKVNVLRSIQPIDPLEVNKWVVRAQYSAGDVEGKRIPGYLETEGIPPNSTTETFVAWKLEIDNWRWNGVPFYLRTGKALPSKVSEINVMFRRPPLMYFGNRNGRRQHARNSITLRIQPDESIILSFDAKLPGPQIDVEQVNMDFTYSQAFGENLAEAYERLSSTPCSATAPYLSAVTKPSWPGTGSPTSWRAGNYKKKC